jgi:undecaprenyl-phosphate 4-deoxy-4-formamido-L-arabinose transferase
MSIDPTASQYRSGKSDSGSAGERPELSIVVPVYRSAGTLDKLQRRVADAMTELGVSYELILVEDCGGDNSWSVIQGLAEQNPSVRGLRLARNFGQHNALLAGIRLAEGVWITTIDDDLQNPPEEIWKLFAKAREGYDVVYGKPGKQTHGVFRDMASTVTKMVLRGAMGAEVATNVSAFRVFRTSLREAFENYQSPTVNIDVLLTWGTHSYAAIEVLQAEREAGESGYTLRKLIAHTMNMMTGFSVLPLQVASLAGFFFAVFGLGVLAYVVIRYLIDGSPVPGFPFLASIISLFAGIQLFALGIIGEYLARMHMRSMNQPAYVVADRTDEKESG